MFDWMDDPATRFDLLSMAILNAFVVFGALERHREKTAAWLPNLLKAVRDEKI
jgi:hypothetical protein